MIASGMKLNVTNTTLDCLNVYKGISANIKIPLICPELELPEILFITSFPPRECGIATYTQDLVKALKKQFSYSFNCSICALESESEHPVYSQPPRFIMNTDDPESFMDIAIEINRSKSIRAVVIQHEFGFFVNKEIDFSLFINTITKPIVFVFHTVLPGPSQALKNKVQAMARVATSIIVMTNNASSLLVHDYLISADKLTVIPHGTHLVIPLNKDKLKEKYSIVGRKILSTFGLLSLNKGVEVTLNALPSIIAEHPDVLFLILGKTHPTIVKNEGEKYRLMLEEKVQELNLSDHVRFVNEYLLLPVLLEYLQLTDIYLFTSTDPNQAVSGTFSYAISTGCPIISTPIPHAQELLTPDTGLLIDFDNSTQLSNAAVQLLNNEKWRQDISLHALQKMAPTAWENSAIAHAKLFEKLVSSELTLNWDLPALSLDHIIRMTTDFGMIQFSKIAQPDFDSGYTVDDNARALIALCQHYQITESKNDLLLINTYLHYINYCLQPDGKILNYVDIRGNTTEQNNSENLEDSNGRAVWALGYVISLEGVLPDSIIDFAQSLFAQVGPHLDKIHSTRAMAFIIKGLYYQNGNNSRELITLFANRLVQMYRHERKDNWHWFESYMTYGNSVLPEALLCAYLSTNNLEYKNIAKEGFDFLLSKIFVHNQVKVVSNKGWLHYGRNNRVAEVQIGGEQPIDVAYTVIALEKFYEVFNEQGYKQQATVAFNWFLGQNHLNQIIYNPCTGGCYDGLEEFNVNLNQGAESAVSYLMARIAIGRIIVSDQVPLVIPSVLFNIHSAVS